MKAKTLFSALIALALLLSMPALPALGEQPVDVSALYKKKDVDDTWSADEAQAIDLNAYPDGSVVRITEKGDYILSGTLRGQILIEAGEEEKVRLILNGVAITADEGPAIYEKQADKLIVTLADGTENTLTGGTAITDADDTIAAALYAEDDLSLNGSGSLVASGTIKHGIQSKADLVIANGKITVSAALDGIRGRNSVLVLDGEISVTAGGDGITSTRTDADGKGWVVLAGGSVTVKTGDGAGTARAAQNSQGGFGGRGRWDDWGSASGTADDGVSQKAVKAATDLTVLGGSYTFDCADDGLHAVNVTVNGGTFSIRSGDDAMHADEDMTVNAGTISVSQCYEGLEGKNVTINGGDITIIASDDGVNAAGGSDGSGFGGWGRGGMANEMDNGGMLSVTGGKIAVTAGGDGLDSNGSLLLSGGVIGVWAASTGGEGSIDFNGTGTLSGGTLIVASTGGVMRDALGLSGQSVMAFSASGSAGETVRLLDENANVLGEFTPDKAFDTLMVSSSQLKEGSAFTVKSGEKTLYSGTLTASMNGATVNNGFGRNGFGGDMPGGFDGNAPGGSGAEGNGFDHGKNRRGW